MNDPQTFVKKLLTQISSADLYATLSTVEQDVIYILTPLGFIVELSPNFEKVTGWKPTDWIGKHVKDVIIPQDYPAALVQLLALKQGKIPKPVELRIRVKNSVCLGKFFARSLVKDKKVIGIIGIAKDITVEREQTYTHSKNQLINIFEHVADGVTVQDRHGVLILANEAAAIASGYSSAAEMLANPARWVTQFELFDEQGNTFSLDNLPGRKVINGSSKAEALFQFKNKRTDESRWVIVKSRPVFDVMGNLNMVINIMHDVTKSKHLEEKKEEFISMASHELKTPLTSINIYLDILRKRLRPKDTTNTVFISKIERQMNKLMKLVTDLLDITRIKAGKIIYKMEQFDLSEVIMEVIEPIQEMNTKHMIKINSADKIHVYADKYRINQVITNLLSNAIKYSPDGGTITVSLQENSSEVVVSIKDQGIGIDTKHHKKIFERMYQINENVDRTFPGLGIGLYISSEIIKRHNGAIWVTSNTGKGSTFHFSLLKTKVP